MNIHTPPRESNPSVPEDLKVFPQFVVWKLIDGRKVPFNPTTGQAASSTDPTTWGSYEQACLAYQAGGYHGIGFVFTEADPFGFLDLDSCIDPTQEWQNLMPSSRKPF